MDGRSGDKLDMYTVKRRKSAGNDAVQYLTQFPASDDRNNSHRRPEAIGDDDPSLTVPERPLATARGHQIHLCIYI